MLNRISVLFIFLGICFLFFGCEQEGNPLTIEEIFEATEGDRPLFRAQLDFETFNSENVQGAKVGNEYVFRGENEKGTISINLEDIRNGTYSGKNSIRNQIRYVRPDGKVYITNRPDETSDSKITVSFFNRDSSTITGTFQGTLYDLKYEKDIRLTKGKFTGIFLDIPFFGFMDAQIGAERFDSEDCTFRRYSTGGIQLDQITASTPNDTMRITLNLEERITVGTYDLADPEYNATYNSNVFSSNLARDQYQASSGKIVIAKIDLIRNRIIGNYNFNAVNQIGTTLRLTNGSFEALITN